METVKGYSAKARFLRISPTKVRRIANTLRKKSCSEVLATLDHLPHKGAHFLKKVIKSAVSNALYKNNKLDEDMLYENVYTRFIPHRYNYSNDGLVIIDLYTEEQIKNKEYFEVY